MSSEVPGLSEQLSSDEARKEADIISHNANRLSSMAGLEAPDSEHYKAAEKGLESTLEPMAPEIKPFIKDVIAERTSILEEISKRLEPDHLVELRQILGSSEFRNIGPEVGQEINEYLGSRLSLDNIKPYVNQETGECDFKQIDAYFIDVLTGVDTILKDWAVNSAESIRNKAELGKKSINESALINSEYFNYFYAAREVYFQVVKAYAASVYNELSELIKH